MLKTEPNCYVDGIPSVFIEGDKQKNIIVMTHGILGSRNEYLDTFARIAEKLEKDGIASIRFDFVGHGVSAGELDDFSLQSQISDLQTIIDWVFEKGYQRITLLGLSFGAPPAIVCAALNDSIVQKCVLLAPVLDYRATFLYPSTSWGIANFGIQKIVEGINKGKLVLEEDYYLSSKVLMDLLLVDIPSYSRMFETSCIIFHGKSDDMVPLSASRAFASSLKNVKLIEMERTEHGLTEVDDVAFTSDITLYNLNCLVEELKQS